MTETIPASITPKNRLLLGRPIFEIYEATRYEVRLPGPHVKVTLRHGETTAALDSLLTEEAPEWAFITAWNPGSRQLSRTENRRRQHALVAGLPHRYRVFP